LYVAVQTTQTVHIAPANAPSSGVLAPASEPGPKLSVSGVVVAADGVPIPGASIYAYQTDAEGYYGVKPVSDNRNPRLKLLLRSGPRGEWSFQTIRPGSYPSSRVPAHVHFEVSAPGFADRIFEIVFEGDPFITDDMRRNPAFSVRPVAAGRGTPAGVSVVTERIVLSRR
jgi:protocatechuate 3,4-dioxygenase beta subunit